MPGIIIRPLKADAVREPETDDGIVHVDTPMFVRVATVAVFALAMFVLFLIISRLVSGSVIPDVLVWTVYAGLVARAVQQALKYENWVSFSFSEEGVFFPSVKTGCHAFVPWAHIGAVEKSFFGVFTRGLRFEVDKVDGVDQVANVLTHPNTPGMVYATVKSDIRNRDVILRKIEALKTHHGSGTHWR